MKNLFIYLILISLSYLPTYGQGIYLGKDTTFCSTVDTIKIANNLSISGSSLNMDFEWSGNYTYAGSVYSVKSILNNSTIPNPIIVDRSLTNTWIKFVLTAKQGGNIYKDSINIRISSFVYLTGYTVEYLAPGDSIQFNATTVGGGIPPLTFYKWEPEAGLRDPFSLTTYCRQTLTNANTSLKYSAIVKDSAGCSGGNEVYEIRYKTPANNIIKTTTNNSAYFNAGNIFFPNPEKELAEIDIYNEEGSLIFSGITNGNIYKLSLNMIKHKFLIIKIRFPISKKIYHLKILQNE